MSLSSTTLRRCTVALLAGLLVAAALVIVTSRPVAAAPGDDEDVIFDGAGWGHGVGMSQFGAWGMSVLGAKHRPILKHYYQGVGFETISDTPPIWVNLESDFEELVLRVEAIGTGGSSVEVFRPNRTVIAEVGATIKFKPKGETGCRAIITQPDGDKQFLPSKRCIINLRWYKWKKEGATPTTKMIIDGCILANWNTSPTSYPECQYARGTLRVRSGEGGLDLSATMLLEDYVLGISEMPYYWADQGGVQALRAQAVAARSFARELQLARGWVKDNSCDAWCHVRDTTADQRYVGWGHGVASWVNAVQATDGRVAVHDDAQYGIVRTYYFSSSAGLTENGDERFGLTPKEYYTSVDDSVAVDGTVPNPNASWTVTVAAADIAAELDFDQLTGVTVTSTRTSGSAALVQYDGVVDGEVVSVEKTGTWTRTTLGLKSEWFSVDYSAPVEAGDVCVIAQAGDGWWTTTVRLGLPGSDYELVRAANPDAENDAGFLIAGTQVCAPTMLDSGTAPTGSVPQPATTSCTVVGPGEGWWAQAEKLGITGAQWPILLSANAGAVSAGGQLTVGAVVCLPGSDAAPSQPTAPTQCTTALPGEGWLAVGARLGWPYSEWRALADANPAATTSSGSLNAGAEVCLPG